MHLATHAKTARRLAVAAVVTLITAAAVAACGGSSSSTSSASAKAQTPAQVEAAAKKEGQVVVYTSFPDFIQQPLNAAFQKKYGITVKSQRLVAGAFDARVQSELQAGQHEADVILNGDTSADIAWRNKGWIAKIPNSDLSSISGWPSAHWNGYWADIQTIFYGIMYNTKVVPAADVPTTWKDLLNPALKGKLLLVDPKGGTTSALPYDLLLKTEGASYLKSLGSQGKLTPSGLPASQSVGSGAAAAYVPAIQPFYSAGKAAGQPIAIVYPSPSVGDYLEASVLAGAPHPNAGILYVDFTMSPAGQAIINAGGYSVRSDVPGVKQVPSYVQQPDYTSTLADTNKIIQLVGG
jgi:iron(III) transport system substrate-binding protein